MAGTEQPTNHTLADEAEAALAAVRARDGDSPPSTGIVPDGPTVGPEAMVTEIGRYAVAETVGAIGGVFLMMGAVLVAIPIFLVTGFAFVAIAGLLHPDDTLAGVLFLVWFVSFLLLTGIALMRIFRKFGLISSRDSMPSDPGDQK
jgi:hypothetical protein